MYFLIESLGLHLAFTKMCHEFNQLFGQKIVCFAFLPKSNLMKCYHEVYKETSLVWSIYLILENKRFDKNERQDSKFT